MDILNVFSLIALSIGAVISFDAWKRDGNEFYLKYFLLAISAIILICWMYFARNVLYFYGEVAKINNYFVLALKIVVLILAVITATKDFLRGKKVT